jgi:hypothetical protein
MGDEEFRNSNNFENTGATSATFASAFKGRSTAMSTDDLRKARESRAADALRMKDEQLAILSEQNSSLMDSLNKVLFYCIFLKSSFDTYMSLSFCTIVGGGSEYNSARKNCC